MYTLDKIDKRILARLQQDGRLTNAKLADELSLSETPCWRRVKKLEEAGVIEGYQARLNRQSLGFGVVAFVQLTYIAHDEETTYAFEQVIRHCDYVLSCHNTTGEADFLLHVVARDLDDYSKFVDSVLRKLKGVSSIRSSISLKEVKGSSQLPVV
ncbi:MULTISPECIES: Lrp/AsnC family transcriptional regulator [Pseudoalteromonas]|uniref:Lrp/AsnC family transcriptional regulator n=1 Tax=Pseudoalteromonas rubra TaxID=43658 RepID=A0A5S3X3D7_9GAMM|nr:MULTISPECIES: Lrp/AsnC family transcriptional regulator [Pseudoalteromonas]AZZ98860.1 Lrp/AsnC family transcriptional regulator [Pseudoalteromonas sp. R3]MCG7562359.1 Lrp/AsnC family transcriptional regulator [Pseudoalteromonas sp. McH1-42]TMP38144.1 Lrp/AsnC family transcriptional regulator [Pseudoalteromonas rubra]